MRKINMTRMTGAAAALFLAALLAGCGNSGRSESVGPGAAKVLEKLMPARYNEIVLEVGGCLLFHKPASEVEIFWNELFWTAKSSNAHVEAFEQDMTPWWRLSAHRDGTHWLVDDDSIDPKATSPEQMASFVQSCLNAADEDDQATAKKATEEARKASVDWTAQWQATAKGFNPLDSQTREN
jgi:hypothetical protein